LRQSGADPADNGALLQGRTLPVKNQMKSGEAKVLQQACARPAFAKLRRGRRSAPNVERPIQKRRLLVLGRRFSAVVFNLIFGAIATAAAQSERINQEAGILGPPPVVTIASNEQE